MSCSILGKKDDHKSWIFDDFGRSGRGIFQFTIPPFIGRD